MLSSGNTLEHNTATGNGTGFHLHGASGNTLTANTANGNGGGFFIESIGTLNADNNVLRANDANANGWDGFAISGNGNPVSGTILDGNIANDNAIGGFDAWRATGTTWTGNTANDNGNWGFILYGECNGNTLTSNVARRNGEQGYELANGSSNNTFSGTRRPRTAPTASGWAARGRGTGVSSNDASGNTLAASRSGLRAATRSSATGRPETGSNGFELGGGSNGNTLTGNTATGGGHGFWVNDSANNVLTANRVSRHDTSASSSSRARPATSSQPIRERERDFGFMLSEQYGGNTLTGNTARNDHGGGIWLDGASGNTLIANTASDNSGGGFGIVNGSSRQPSHRQRRESSNGRSGGLPRLPASGCSPPSEKRPRRQRRPNNGDQGFGFGAWRSDRQHVDRTTPPTTTSNGFARVGDGVQRQHAQNDVANHNGEYGFLIGLRLDGQHRAAERRAQQRGVRRRRPEPGRKRTPGWAMTSARPTSIGKTRRRTSSSTAARRPGRAATEASVIAAAGLDDERRTSRSSTTCSAGRSEFPGLSLARAPRPGRELLQRRPAQRELVRLRRRSSLTGYAGKIDHGTVAYVLSGWLGGYDGQDDNATLTVTFQDGTASRSEPRRSAPVLAADRGNVSGFIDRGRKGRSQSARGPCSSSS